jgi:hypothetical protein
MVFELTGVLGEVGSSMWDCFLELDLPSGLFELERFRFNPLVEPERFRFLIKDPPSPSPRESFFVDGTSSFSYVSRKRERERERGRESVDQSGVVQ